MFCFDIMLKLSCFISFYIKKLNISKTEDGYSFTSILGGLNFVRTIEVRVDFGAN